MALLFPLIMITQQCSLESQGDFFEILPVQCKQCILLKIRWNKSLGSGFWHFGNVILLMLLINGISES